MCSRDTYDTPGLLRKFYNHRYEHNLSTSKVTYSKSVHLKCAHKMIWKEAGNTVAEEV